MNPQSNPEKGSHASDIATAPETVPSGTLATLGSSATREFIRYFIASALALVVDVGLLYVLTSIVGLSYLWSGAIAFLVGLIIVYVLSIIWVFEHRRLRTFAFEFFLFTVIGIAGLALNELILFLLTSIAGLYYMVSKVASVIVVFTWNFAVRKFLLFR